MHIKNILPIALVASVSAQSNLTQVLAANNDSLSTLTSLLSAQPALVSTLTGLTNITILAPHNSAFSTFLNTTAGKTASMDPSAVASLLTYHVLNGSYPASAFTSTPLFIPSLLTNASYANVTGGQVVEAIASGSSVTFTSGLLSKSTVTTANVPFTGGIIHIIDTVLTIPESDAATAEAANLTALAGALITANLVDTVDGLKDVTIFAPSNAAFQAIGSAVGTLTMQQLTGILEYHVVQGVVGYSSLLGNMSLPTVGGGNVTITVENGNVFVNSAEVITPNVLVANGVVHVIDAVLNPNNTMASPNPSTTTAAFSGASSASNVPFTSGVMATQTVASSATSAGGAGATTQASAGAAALARETGAIGLGMLFGAGGMALLMA